MWSVNRSDPALMKINECYFNIKNSSCEMTCVHLETKQTNLQDHQFQPIVSIYALAKHIFNYVDNVMGKL